MHTPHSPQWASQLSRRLAGIKALAQPTPDDVRRYGATLREDWGTPDAQRRDWNLCLATMGTNTWPELFFVNKAAATANANSSSEASLLAGLNAQPTVSPPTWAPQSGRTSAVSLWASGILSTTGTPTLTFYVRSSTTQGSGTLSGTVLGQSAAITTGSGVSNKLWELELHALCFTPGQGTGNATLSAYGWVRSPGGFASPFNYAITPGGGDSNTLTASLDGSLTQFLNVSCTWSAASSSNTITLQNTRCVAWN